PRAGTSQPPGDRPVRIRMRQRTQVGFSLLAILAAGMTLSAAWPTGLPGNDVNQDESRRPELTAQEIHNLVAQAIENQRRNDLMLDQYARTEHSVFHGSAKDSKKEVINRVIPAGEGIVRVELER